MNKFLFLFSFLFLLTSCQYIEKRVPSEEELLQQRLKEIDWKEVTVYPSVAECDSLLDKEQKKECFFNFMTVLIQQKIAPDSINQKAKIIDTIQVKVSVYPNATISFEPLFPSDSLNYDKIIIDSLIKSRLTGFPKIEPAQKEGIPVKTQFILPVILKME